MEVEEVEVEEVVEEQQEEEGEDEEEEQEVCLSVSTMPSRVLPDTIRRARRRTK